MVLLIVITTLSVAAFTLLVFRKAKPEFGHIPVRSRKPMRIKDKAYRS